jgi:hypothetical protein
MLLVVIGLLGTTIVVSADDVDKVDLTGATTGVSKLKRGDDGISAKIKATLPAGHAVTVWVIINDKASEPAFLGTGVVVPGNGKATFKINASEDDHILDSENDKITFKLKDHGPFTGDIGQLTTPNDGCPGDPPACPTVGTAVHEPDDDGSSDDGSSDDGSSDD